MKVGDTFRVFEVVNPKGVMVNRKGKTGIELNFNQNSHTPHRLSISILTFFPEELKQVGTIRIKSLKNGK